MTARNLYVLCQMITDKHGIQCYKNGCPFGKEIDGKKPICDRYTFREVANKSKELYAEIEQLRAYANGEKI